MPAVPGDVRKAYEVLAGEGADVDEAARQDGLPVAAVGLLLPTWPADTEKLVQRCVAQNPPHAEVDAVHSLRLNVAPWRAPRARAS
jgi:hypothetical protein